jgi:hypothetical protein
MKNKLGSIRKLSDIQPVTFKKISDKLYQSKYAVQRFVVTPCLLICQRKQQNILVAG